MSDNEPQDAELADKIAELTQKLGCYWRPDQPTEQTREQLREMARELEAFPSVVYSNACDEQQCVDRDLAQQIVAQARSEQELARESAEAMRIAELYPTDIRTHPGRWVFDLLGGIAGWIAKARRGWPEKLAKARREWPSARCFYIFFGLLLTANFIIVLIGKPHLTRESFEVHVVQARRFDQDPASFVKLKYLDKGKLHYPDIEGRLPSYSGERGLNHLLNNLGKRGPYGLTVYVTLSNAKVLRYKILRSLMGEKDWGTNAERQIIVPGAIPVERVSISGSAYRNGEDVTIGCSWFFDNLAPATTPAPAIPTVAGNEVFGDLESALWFHRNENRMKKPTVTVELPYQRLNRLKKELMPTRQFVAQMMLERGEDERFVWAYLETGLSITEANKAAYPPENVAKWYEARQAYDEATPAEREILMPMPAPAIPAVPTGIPTRTVEQLMQGLARLPPATQTPPPAPDGTRGKRVKEEGTK